ncbi:Uma2 family endonuclease [Amycolatopsis sp. H20-H5]|uniref:Uma2 family endonuclease n=1 Tax=Amycolatopsis sp. H20-H5 TaxID=3046309 RepID=UPI002DBD3830|nr:Uma2 family endonuclease [Amycolatopsis sp. H20-H5]MEC3979590.1 Uma2 family endonuclease [Amycolatopsis sp. H20-H5]
MTALPEPNLETQSGLLWDISFPDHLLSIAEYAALGETESGFTELVEGRLLMSPSPKARHNIASGNLFLQLGQQLPPELKAIQDIDVDLSLAPVPEPGWSRRPDLIVVRRDAIERVDEENNLFRADEVLIVVEIVSPGSKRTDYVTKHGEYADAGIPHYWIIDLADPISLVSCHQAGELGYQNAPAATGKFSTTEPFPIELDLERLRA